MKLHSVWFKAYVALSDPGVIWAVTIIWSKQALCCAFFGSKIIFLTFLDISNANLNETETLKGRWSKKQKKMKEILLNTIYNPDFHFMELEFQTIEIQSFSAKLEIFHTFFLNSKLWFGGPVSYWNTPTKTWFIKKPSRPFISK